MSETETKESGALGLDPQGNRVSMRHEFRDDGVWTIQIAWKELPATYIRGMLYDLWDIYRIHMANVARKPKIVTSGFGNGLRKFLGGK
jgi:hypothetical protein